MLAGPAITFQLWPVPTLRAELLCLRMWPRQVRHLEPGATARMLIGPSRRDVIRRELEPQPPAVTGEHGHPLIVAVSLLAAGQRRIEPSQGPDRCVKHDGLQLVNLTVMALILPPTLTVRAFQPPGAATA